MPTAFVVRERVPSFRFEFLACGLDGSARRAFTSKQRGPELRPGGAGLSAGRPHTGGDAAGATARGPPQMSTSTPVEECAGFARARSARSAVPKTRAKAQLSRGLRPGIGRVRDRMQVAGRETLESERVEQ